MTHYGINFENMYNRPLREVTLSGDKGAVTFRFADGGERSFDVYGDCCSHSWVEHLQMPTDVNGANILQVIDSDVITQDHDAHDEENGGDSIQVYNTIFRTDRGDIVLEYRNSSNGCYGGSLGDA